MVVQIKNNIFCSGFSTGSGRRVNFTTNYVLTSYGKGAGSNSFKSKKCISWGNSLSGIKLTSII